MRLCGAWQTCAFTRGRIRERWPLARLPRVMNGVGDDFFGSGSDLNAKFGGAAIGLLKRIGGLGDRPGVAAIEMFLDADFDRSFGVIAQFNLERFVNRAGVLVLVDSIVRLLALAHEIESAACVDVDGFILRGVLDGVFAGK